MGYPEKDDEVLILNRFLTSNPEITLEKVATCEDVIAMKEDAKNVYIHPVLIEYIVELARMTRNEENVLTGVSPRGTLGMYQAEIMLCQRILRFWHHMYGHTDLFYRLVL